MKDKLLFKLGSRGETSAREEPNTQLTRLPTVILEGTKNQVVVALPFLNVDPDCERCGSISVHATGCLQNFQNRNELSISLKVQFRVSVAVSVSRGWPKTVSIMWTIPSP